MGSKKKWYKWTYKTETDSKRRTYGCQGEGWGEEIGIWGWTYPHCCIYYRISRPTWTYYTAQGTDRFYAAAWDGRGVWGRLGTRICVAESILCSPEIVATLLIGYTPTQNKKCFFFLFKKESACWCRGHRFNPWSGKIPRASKELRRCTTTTEACAV